MKIAFLCKRQYMSKDVILDKYARLYEIPNQLSLLGHDIQCFCLSYQDHESGVWDESTDSKKLIWNSKSYKGIKKIGLLSYPFYLLKQLKEFQPDVVIGASDIPHIVIANWCAKKLQKPFVADLYDNFEGFGQAKIPLMVPLLRNAVCDADLISTTSQPLADLMKDEYGAQGVIFSMPSTIDADIFKVGNKIEARQQLGLPANRILIGTAGGLYRDKGVNVIYDAWIKLKEQIPNVDLVLAGPYKDDLPPPKDERVHYLGSLEHHQVAKLFQSLDIGIISILDTPFGKYCFPQKAYEMLACNLPVVVAAVGEMKHLFKLKQHMLFEAGNAEDLVEKISLQVRHPTQPSLEIDDWSKIIGSLEQEILKLKQSY